MLTVNKRSQLSTEDGQQHLCKIAKTSPIADSINGYFDCYDVSDMVFCCTKYRKVHNMFCCSYAQDDDEFYSMASSSYIPKSPTYKPTLPAYIPTVPLDDLPKDMPTIPYSPISPEWDEYYKVCFECWSFQWMCLVINTEMRLLNCRHIIKNP